MTNEEEIKRLKERIEELERRPIVINPTPIIIQPPATPNPIPCHPYFPRPPYYNTLGNWC